MTKIAASALICFAFWKAGHDDVLAFTASSTVTRQAPFTSTSVLDAMPKKSGRRAFLDGAAVATSALMLPLIAVSQPARAADADAGDDLSMPSEEEIKKSDADAAAERLRRKAELQKQSAKPATFTESFAAEKEKQKSLEKSKEERRNAMCEELGRGC